MTFQVKTANNTYFDLMPYIMVGGLSWKRKYVDGGNAMTMQDGTTMLDRITDKGEWTAAFKPMTASDQATILGLLSPQSVTLKVTDPQTGEDAAAVYYVSEVPASYLIQRTGGTEYWGGMTATFSAR